MSECLFVYADGVREFRDAEPNRAVWLVRRREPVVSCSFVEVLGANPPIQQRGRILTFRREERWYDGDWSGPLESWWRWGERTVYEKGLPNEISLRFTGETSLARTKRMKLLPTIGLQYWPVEKTVRVEVRFVEERS